MPVFVAHPFCPSSLPILTAWPMTSFSAGRCGLGRLQQLWAQHNWVIVTRLHPCMSEWLFVAACPHAHTHAHMYAASTCTDGRTDTTLHAHTAAELLSRLVNAALRVMGCNAPAELRTEAIAMVLWLACMHGMQACMQPRMLYTISLVPDFFDG